MKALFVGDICIRKKQLKNSIVSEEIKSLMEGCSIRAFNMEGAIDGASNNPIIKKGPLIYQNKDVLKVLSADGFNYASLANNHIMDMGVQGLISTMNSLDANNIRYSGACLKNDSYKSNPCVICMDGMRVALFSVAENGFGCAGDAYENRAGYAWMMDWSFFYAITEAKREYDIVLVICHAGAEEYELPLPELRALYKRMIDVGADAVVAHHPHVCQGIELYNTHPIIYSLGNFAFDSADNPDVAYNPEGMMVILDIQKEGSILCKTVPTIYKNGVINIGDVDKHKKWLKEQEEILSDTEKYTESIDAYCDKAFNETYCNYYDVSRGLHLYRFRSKLSTYAKLIFGMRVIDDVMLYHNIEIETHRWIVSRAIRNRYGII